MSDLCTVCGLPIAVGDYPCIVTPRVHAKGTSQITRDEIPGGMWQENGFTHPRQFYSKSERDRALAEKGLEIHAVNAGPHDTLVAKWATMDAYTLAAAKSLVEHAAMATSEPPEPDVPVTWTVQDWMGDRP